MMGDLSEFQIKLARHALGFDQQVQGKPIRVSYRNRYYSPPGGPEYKAWMEMVEGRWAALNQVGNSCRFELTRAGAKVVLRPGESLCPEDFPEDE